MTQKIVSQLDSEGYFVGPVTADESPLEPGVYLIPGGAVDKAPLKTIDPAKRYKIAGTTWKGEALPVPELPTIVEIQERTRIDVITSQLAEIERLQNLQNLMEQADALRAELASLTT